MATERKNPFTGQTHLTPSDLTSKRILVFDLETTELAPKGRSPKGLNISVGAVRDLSTGQTTVYGHNEVPNLDIKLINVIASYYIPFIKMFDEVRNLIMSIYCGLTSR
jgi:hypothetical protein